MNGMDPQVEDRARQLMMAELDGEIEPAERAELERILQQSPSLRAEWQSLKQVKEVTQSMALRPAPDEVWKDYWASVYSRIERGVGWILASIGAIVVGSYAAWMGFQQLLADTTLPWFVKAGILLLAFGVVVLLVSVLREKLFVRRRQRYKDVEI